MLTREAFAQVAPGEVGDPPRTTTVVHSLTVPDRQDVDDLLAKALAAGGRPAQPAQMDQLHVVN